MTQATHVYNNMHPTLRTACKQYPSILQGQIEQHRLKLDEADILKQLIFSEGAYDIAKHHNINNLQIQKETIIQKRAKQFVKQNKTNQKSSQKTEMKEEETIDWHPKLWNLSCVRKPSNKPLSVRRRAVAKEVNKMTDLDRISAKYIQEIVCETEKLLTKYDYLKNRLSLKWVQKLQKLNIKNNIELKTGKKGKGGEITHCINGIAFQIERWTELFNTKTAQINKLITKINNIMVKSNLAVYNPKKNKFIPTLTMRRYNLHTQMTESIMNGNTLYDYATSIKNKFITLDKQFETINKYVQTQLKCKRYQTALTKKDQQTRAAQHRKGDQTKNDNKKVKQGLAPTNRTQKKASNEKSKPNEQIDDTAQTNTINSYFKRSKKRKNVNINNIQMDIEPSNKKRRISYRNNVLIECMNVSDHSCDDGADIIRNISIECCNKPNVLDEMSANIDKVREYILKMTKNKNFRIELKDLSVNVGLREDELRTCIDHLEQKEAIVFVSGSTIHSL